MKKIVITSSEDGDKITEIPYSLDSLLNYLNNECEVTLYFTVKGK